jgi:hypothetical protein
MIRYLVRLLVCILLLSLLACQRQAITIDRLGRQGVDALRSGDHKNLERLLVSKAEFRYLSGRMKRSREYHEFDEAKRRAYLGQMLSIAHNYNQNQEKKLVEFDQMRKDAGARYGIDWGSVQFERVQTYEHSLFMNQERYDELHVFLRSGTTLYDMQVDGIINVHGSWKMVANTIQIEQAL